MTHIPGSDDFNVVFVGAGNIMFGMVLPPPCPAISSDQLHRSQALTKVHGTTLSASSSTSWPLFSLNCNLILFSSKLGPRLKVVALIDPAIERATAVLQKKCESFVVSAYQGTRVFKTLDDFVKNMAPKDRPRAIIVGSPPMFRGTTKPGRDIEMQILKYFPGVALFIEKPIATGPEAEIADAFTIAKTIKDSDTICSVGYDYLSMYLIKH